MSEEQILQEIEKLSPHDAYIRGRCDMWDAISSNDRKEILADIEQILRNLEKVKSMTGRCWIPVSERLPEFTINKLVVGTQFTEDVLVYDGADFRVGYFARKDKLDCNYWVVYGEDYFEPIAWMPIRPYKASPTG